MSKGEGKKIAVKFNMPLVGDVEGNENAFTIEGREYLYTDGPFNNGEVLDKTHRVGKTEDYPLPMLWMDSGNGDMEDVELERGKIVLGRKE